MEKDMLPFKTYSNTIQVHYYLFIGLQATYTAAYPKTPQELVKAINTLKLEYTTETKFLFS